MITTPTPTPVNTPTPAPTPIVSAAKPDTSLNAIPGENFQQYEARLNATTSGTTPPTPTAPTTPTMPSTITAPTPAATTTSSFTPPQPTAPTALGNYFTGVAADAATASTNLQNQYKSDMAANQASIDSITSLINGITSSQQGNLAAIQQLSQPFQAAYQAAQQEALGINKNFQTNQKLADMLTSLATQAQTSLTANSNRPASSTIIDGLAKNTQTAIAAQTSVIQAAMSANSGQITEAQNQIDKGLSAMVADQTDQLNYYTTLNTFLQGQKDDDNKTLIQLNANQQKFVDDQISTLQDSLKSAQASADSIKNAMTDPNTAQAYAQAGVKLGDTTEQINQKLGTYAYSQEISQDSKDMADKGYQAVIPGQAAPQGATVVTIVDSKGVSHKYFNPTSGGAITPDEIATIQSTFPSFNGQTYVTATQLAGLTTAQRAAVTLDNAGKAIPVLTTQAASALTSITAAQSDLQTISDSINSANGVLPSSSGFLGFGAAPLQATKVTLNQWFQKNPSLGSFNDFQTSVFNIISALKGVSTGGGGASRLFTTISKYLPVDTDTLEQANDKITNLNSIIDSNANAIVDTNAGDITNYNGIVLPSATSTNAGSTYAGVTLPN